MPKHFKFATITAKPTDTTLICFSTWLHSCSSHLQQIASPPRGSPAPAADWCMPPHSLALILLSAELEALLHAAGKLQWRGGKWTDCPLEVVRFQCPYWKTDFKKVFIFCLFYPLYSLMIWSFNWKLSYLGSMGLIFIPVQGV